MLDLRAGEYEVTRDGDGIVIPLVKVVVRPTAVDAVHPFACWKRGAGELSRVRGCEVQRLEKNWHPTLAGRLVVVQAVGVVQDVERLPRPKLVVAIVRWLGGGEEEVEAVRHESSVGGQGALYHVPHLRQEVRHEVHVVEVGGVHGHDKRVHLLDPAPGLGSTSKRKGADLFTSAGLSHSRRCSLGILCLTAIGPWA